MLVFSGRPQEGLASIKTCMALDPREPTLPFRLAQVALAFYFLRDYEAAVEAARRAVRSYPDLPNPRRCLVAALGQLGRKAEAKEALDQAVTAGPTTFAVWIYKRPPFWRSEDHAHIVEGLRKAGWQG